MLADSDELAVCARKALLSVPSTLLLHLFAMLDNHYSSHREREASTPVSIHTNTQEAAASHAVWRAQAPGGAAHGRPY